MALQKLYGRSDPYYLYELEIVDTTAAPAVTEKVCIYVSIDFEGFLFLDLLRNTFVWHVFFL